MIDGAIVTVRQYSMKHLISLLLCLVLLNFSLTFVSARDVSRWKRQDELPELPEDFKCEYCSFCGKPCAKTCGLCAGCDLIKALGFSTDNLQNFGVNVKDCGTFCSNGTEGCTQQCEENQQDCELCTRCD